MGAVLLLAPALVASPLLGGCGRREAPAPSPSRPPDTTAATAPPESALISARAESTLVLRYHPYAVTGDSALRALIAALGDSAFANVLKLNRVDLGHVRSGDTLVIPEPANSLRLLSPFPDSLPTARDLPRLLLVSLRVQAFAAYDSGRLARWGPTSTGRRDRPTPPGLYHTNWKSRQRVSTIDESWLLKWYVNLESREGISLHLYELPGRPASHSCVRLLEDDARWIYEWAETWNVAPDGRTVLRQGTPVVVFGRYAYGRRRPWRLLPEDPHAAAIPRDEVEQALAIHLGPAALAETAALLPDSAAVADSVRGR